MLPDHLTARAKLLVTADAEFAAAAGFQVMHAHAIVGNDIVDIVAYRFDNPCYFMAESDRQNRYW